MSFSPGILTVNSLATPEGIVIELVGDVNSLTAATFQAALTAAIAQMLAADSGPLTVDMRRVDLLDNWGLSALVVARRQLSPAGHTLRVLLTPGGHPDRVLRRGKFDSILTLISSEA